MSDIEARLKYLEDRFEIQDLICEYVHSMVDKEPEASQGTERQIVNSLNKAWPGNFF